MFIKYILIFGSICYYETTGFEWINSAILFKRISWVNVNATLTHAIITYAIITHAIIAYVIITYVGDITTVANLRQEIDRWMWKHWKIKWNNLIVFRSILYLIFADIFRLEVERSIENRYETFFGKYYPCHSSYRYLATHVAAAILPHQQQL